VTTRADFETVVVLRPARQAARLLELIAGAGLDVVPFPTLEIQCLAADATVAQEVLGRHWDWTIHTSANAVLCASQTLGRLPAASRHAAIGCATARVLEQHGIRIDACPADATSEGLLALPQFAQPAGQQVLLVKGEGGRTVLRETLGSRGASVCVLDVYRRVPVTPPAASLATLRDRLAGRTGRCVFIATSAEILAALFDATPADLHDTVREAALLVPGTRVAAAAKALRWRGRIEQASAADDDAMLEALRRQRAGPAPAA
jgi:uroporphyrinogen-III synthase